MSISFKARNFYPEEQRLLNILKNSRIKESRSKIKFYHFFIAGVLGACFTYITTIIPDSFWTFLFGTIAIFSFSFIVFTPYEFYKKKRRDKVFLQRLNTLIEKGTVETCIINAKRIAVAEEFEDEGDLYIIEYDTDKILYLWDHNYNVHKKLPCLCFEIYDESSYLFLGRQVYPLSSRINCATIDKKAKWNYMKKIGTPEHLETENKNFDTLIEEFNKCI